MPRNLIPVLVLVILSGLLFASPATALECNDEPYEECLECCDDQLQRCLGVICALSGPGCEFVCIFEWYLCQDKCIEDPLSSLAPQTPRALTGPDTQPAVALASLSDGQFAELLARQEGGPPANC